MAEYFDYADIFSTNLVIKLLENTSMNKYAIELIEMEQLTYGLLMLLIWWN